MKNEIKILYVGQNKKIFEKIKKINSEIYFCDNIDDSIEIFFSKEINFIIASVENFEDFKVLELFKTSNKIIPIIILNKHEITNNKLLLSLVNLEIKGIYLENDESVVLKKIIEKINFYRVYFKNKKFLGMLNNVMDSHKDMLFSIENEDIIYANKKFLDFFNVSSISDFHKKHVSLQNMILKNPLSKISLDKNITTADFVELLYSMKEDNRTIALKNINKEVRIFLIKITFIKEDYRLMHLIDITDMAKRSCLLEEQAHLDNLTRVYNRHRFLEFVDEIEDSEREYSLCIIDIDHFKAVNDEFGHDVGDIVLKEVAGVLKDNIRGNDILARWGGEEFILLLDGVGIEIGYVVAEKLNKKLKEKVIPEIGRNITASIGISSNVMGLSMDEIRIQADKALYEAKRNGRNQVVKYS